MVRRQVSDQLGAEPVYPAASDSPEGVRVTGQIPDEVRYRRAWYAITAAASPDRPAR